MWALFKFSNEDSYPENHPNQAWDSEELKRIKGDTPHGKETWLKKNKKHRATLKEYEDYKSMLDDHKMDKTYRQRVNDKTFHDDWVEQEGSELDKIKTFGKYNI